MPITTKREGAPLSVTGAPKRAVAWCLASTRATSMAASARSEISAAVISTSAPSSELGRSSRTAMRSFSYSTRCRSPERTATQSDSSGAARVSSVT